MKLDTLEIGKDAVVASVASDDQALRQHILDMGLTPGTEVTMMKYAPMGDPLEIRLRGYELTLRKDDAARIELVDVHDTDTGPRANAASGTTEHPALGEGTYSPRAAKRPCPRAHRYILPSPATKTAVKPRCSTSLRAPTSMSVTFPA